MIVGGHGGNIRAASELYGYEPEEFIDFSANINPLGLPEKIRDIIITSISELKNYPDIQYIKLKKSLSDFYNVNMLNIITGNGSAELIDLFIRVSGKRKAAILEPNFFEYERSLRNNGIIPKFIYGSKELGFKLKTADLLRDVEADSILFLSSPNNPAGYIYSKNELIQIAEELKKRKSLLFIDEAFLDFVVDGEKNSLVKETAEQSNIIILKSLTKILAIPGLRLGMLFGPADLISNMKLVQTPWSINIFASKVGEDIKLFENFISESARYIYSEKKIFAEMLKKTGAVKVINGEVNYILCYLKKEYSYAELESFLGQNKILIRCCKNYPGLEEGVFRIAVKTKKENEMFIELLKKFIENK